LGHYFKENSNEALKIGARNINGLVMRIVWFNDLNFYQKNLYTLLVLFLIVFFFKYINPIKFFFISVFFLIKLITCLIVFFFIFYNFYDLLKLKKVLFYFKKALDKNDTLWSIYYREDRNYYFKELIIDLYYFFKKNDTKTIFLTPLYFLLSFVIISSILMLVSCLVSINCFFFINFLLILKITRISIELKVDDKSPRIDNFKNLIFFVFNTNVKVVSFFFIYSFLKKNKSKKNFIKFFYKFLFNKTVGKSK
jgi:hypothetical protein